MRRYAIVALLLAVVGWLAPGTAFAQATGTISGVVTDESGAMLPGVTVEVKNASTGQSRTAVTETDGFYRCRWCSRDVTT